MEQKEFEKYMEEGLEEFWDEMFRVVDKMEAVGCLSDEELDTYLGYLHMRLYDCLQEGKDATELLWLYGENLATRIWRLGKPPDELPMPTMEVPVVWDATEKEMVEFARAYYNEANINGGGA